MVQITELYENAMRNQENARDGRNTTYNVAIEQ